jgi:hypothetical protein
MLYVSLKPLHKDMEEINKFFGGMQNSLDFMANLGGLIRSELGNCTVQNRSGGNTNKPSGDKC